MEIKLSKIAIIAGDARLAEQVCARFRTRGTYVVLFEEPMVRLIEYSVFSSDCTRVSNAVRAHHPEILLLLGCKAEVLTELRAHLPPVEAIEMSVYDDKALSGLPGFRGRATDTNVTPSSKAAGDVVVVEGDNAMALVIAENLAVAHGGCTVVIPNVSEDQCDWAKEQLRTWSNESGTEKDDARRDLMSFLAEQLGELTKLQLNSLTFITKSIPYGLWPFPCPSTHLFSFPLLGVSVLLGMVKSTVPKVRCPQVILIDPGALETSELAPLKTSFGAFGYLIREAIRDGATAMHARFLTEHTPSDFLFYSTHCGEVRGRRITEDFETPDGMTHRITYDLVKSLALSPKPGMIEVQDLRRFIRLDGVDWDDDVGKKRIGAGEILGQFVKVCRKRKGDPAGFRIIQSSESEPVRSSDSMQMHDFAYSPMPQNVGGYLHPLVFNNACSSWRELAMRFGCSGACVYVGTSLDILNSIAISVATKFANFVASGRAVGPSLYRSQKQFILDHGYTPYLMHGYMFTKIARVPASMPAKDLVRRRLFEAAEILAGNGSGGEAHEREVEAALIFLRAELERLR